MENLWCGVATKVAYACRFLVRCPCQILGRDTLLRKRPILELIILTVKAIEGTGMVEDSQVLETAFGAFGDGILRVTAPGAGWADKSAHTICGERVVVERQIALVGAAAT
jgi:hypothetical protein